MKQRRVKPSNRQERGASLLEYAIALALIAIIALAGVRSVGDSTKDVADCVSRNLAGDSCPAAGGRGGGR